jgi:hypothetical protein
VDTTGPVISGTQCSSYEQQVVRILEHSFWLKKRGYREATVRTALHSLKALAKHSDLMDVEKVAEVIAFRNVSEGQKEKLCNVYNRFCNQHDLKGILPNYQRVRTLPFVPKQDEILQLINVRAQTSYKNVLS